MRIPILLIAPVLTKSGPFPLRPLYFPPPSPFITALRLLSLCPPLGHGASTRQSACHASSARPSLRGNQRRFIEQIGSSPSVVGAEPSCSVPRVGGRQRRSGTMVLNPLLLASKVADSTRLWLRECPTECHRVLHTMQFRVHLRGGERGGLRLPFVVEEFDVFTQIPLYGDRD